MGQYFLVCSDSDTDDSEEEETLQTLKIRIRGKKPTPSKGGETEMQGTTNWDNGVSDKSKLKVINKLKKKWNLSKAEIMKFLSSDSNEEEVIPPTQPPPKKSKPAAAAGGPAQKASDAATAKTPSKSSRSSGKRIMPWNWWMLFFPGTTQVT